jgi:tRNA (guanine37-N1)-methyltransferase
MNIDILTILPDLLTGPFEQSILKRSVQKGIVRIRLHDIRKYSTNKHNTVDDYAFGGGAGMVMEIEPVDRLISQLKSEREYDEIVYLTPDGERFDQQLANRFSLKKNIILLCGHYKGVDQRIRDHLITREVSVGDYVLTGGELAAAVVVDAVVRLIRGVLSDETSALTDSFQDSLLAPPVYTRPADYKGWKVPDVLLSGNHYDIETWRMEKAVERTKKLRPDLLNKEEKE